MFSAMIGRPRKRPKPEIANQEDTVKQIFCRGGGVLIAGLVLVLAGCEAKSPEEKVASLRARYKAQMNGFVVQEEPVVVEVTEVAAGAPGAEAEEAATAPSAPVMRQKILLDILVHHDSNERLPGVTLDISMVDAAKNEKGHWLLWVDTSKLQKATKTQLSHVLEDVDYVEGDGFSVEVRHPVPAAERGEYKEFAPAG